MDFFEFWFWHRWFHRDDPNYDDSSVFDGFMKLLLVLFLLVLITMTATRCQNEKSSDRDIITDHQDIRTPAVQRTSDKQTSGQQQIKNQSATLKSTAQQKQHATATTSKTTTSKTATSKTTTARTTTATTKQVADAKRAKSAANQLQKSSAVQNAVVTTTAATTATSPAQSSAGQKPAVKKYNKQYLEVFTEKGELLMYVGMPKDSVKMLMGAPYSTRAYNSEYFGLQETWEYMGRNKYVSEFTFEFENGRLKSLRQYRER